MAQTDQAHSEDTSKQTAVRQHWISILSRSTAEELQTHWDTCSTDLTYKVIRKPETGLVMVRGRAGGRGQRFNVGEATVTRCSVLLSSGEKGHGYVLGRSDQHAELAAAFDACLQKPDLQDALTQSVIAPIERRLAADRLERREKVAATKVDFYTMARGDD